MFESTQSIAPLNEVAGSFFVKPQRIDGPLEAKPACWSQNLMDALNPQRFHQLCSWYFESLGNQTLTQTSTDDTDTLTLVDPRNGQKSSLVSCSANNSVDIKTLKQHLDNLEGSEEHQIHFITNGTFNSSTIDYCARKQHLTLKTKHELLSDILKLESSAQQQLLHKVVEGTYK